MWPFGLFKCKHMKKNITVYIVSKEYSKDWDFYSIILEIIFTIIKNGIKEELRKS
jgi:hypothetical protein